MQLQLVSSGNGSGLTLIILMPRCMLTPVQNTSVGPPQLMTYRGNDHGPL